MYPPSQKVHNHDVNLQGNKEKRLAINIDIDISFTALLCVLDHLKNCVA